MKNLTPQHLRCPAGYCESIHKLDDGRLLIVGKHGFYDDDYLRSDIDPGPDETAVIISPDLLADVEREWRTIDSAPKDGTRVLGARPGCAPDVIFWVGENWFSQSDEISLWASFPPTHWLPIPPLNEREQG